MSSDQLLTMSYRVSDHHHDTVPVAPTLNFKHSRPHRLSHSRVFPTIAYYSRTIREILNLRPWQAGLLSSSI